MPAYRPSGSYVDVCQLGSRCLCKPLPRRQREVLHRLLEGECEKQAAKALGLSIHTIHAHLKRIYTRFGLAGRMELMALALRTSTADHARRKPRQSIGLTDHQRQELLRFIADATKGTQERVRAQIVIQCAAGASNRAAAQATGVSTRTVERIRKRLEADGVGAVVFRRIQPPRPQHRKLNELAEQQMLELSRSRPPHGSNCWTPALLASRMTSLGHTTTVSDDTVRRILRRLAKNSTDSALHLSHRMVNCDK